MDFNLPILNTEFPLGFRRDGKKSTGELTGALRRLRTLETVLDSSNDLIFASDIYTDELIFANRAFAAGVDSAPEALTGRSCSAVLRGWAENADELDPRRRLFGEDGSVAATAYTREFFNRSNGRWYLVRCVLISWTDGSLVRLETATDITAQKECEISLRHYASTDDMTGLYLREYGTELIRQIMGGGDRNAANSLVFIDFDGLKRVNDRFGHTAGDRALKALVGLIGANIRKSDTLCRWGGDEFVLILRADKDTAELIMRKILSKIEEYNVLEADSPPVSFSYGIAAIASGSARSVDELIAEADREMYKRKLNK